MAVTCFTTPHAITMNSGHMQNQLTRSLERILEDANLSGELKLSGRKLKDFPKAAGKYNLADTVFADLSRNRFCELPEDITSFAFLEKLLVYHNAIRNIPETIRGLHSLTYLDLRNNQLAVLPREICFLPLQVLLISNNRLASLPEELGRMEDLTELDAACNQIAHLPARMGDLRNLRSLTLRSNQLVYLPREITYLQLVFLDISNNKISALPIEMKNMSTLVDLELSNNPLTSPPASLCIRGLVHVFKYLDTIAAKDEKNKTLDEKGTLRRQISNKQNSFDSLKAKRTPNEYHSTDGIDKKWSNESHWSPISTPKRLENNHTKIEFSPRILSPTYNDCSNESPNDKNVKTNIDDDQIERNVKVDFNCDNEKQADGAKSDDKKPLGNIQTYREYKEALRQQRSQDSLSIYRSKEAHTPDSGSSNIDSPSSNFSSFKSSPSPSTYSSNQSSPISPHHNVQKLNQLNGNGIAQPTLMSPNRNASLFEEQNSPLNTKKPIQKVVPSRNTSASSTSQSPTHFNGNHIGDNENGKLNTGGDNSYVKPPSPFKVSSILSHNNVPSSINGSTHKSINNSKSGQKINKNVSWNRDVPAEKLSFTMRREFDKHKEETELIKQLRTVIETRLKMSLPDDIGPALMDGVVLCHLANHVRERSVGSIHVPSPTVPKLTMARCRKNVDNFLDACRRIGVDEELICSCCDIVPLQDESNDRDGNQNTCKPPNLTALLRTVTALVNFKTQSRTQGVVMSSTNPYNHTSNHYGNNSREIHENNNTMYADDTECDDHRNVPLSLDLTPNAKRKRKFPSTKYPKYTNDSLVDVIEECEYDSDIGKFKCYVNNNQDDSNADSETSIDSSTYTPTNENSYSCFENLNAQTEKISTKELYPKENVKIVTQRIEFYEGNTATKINNCHINSIMNKEESPLQKVEPSSNLVSTVLCLSAFILTVSILLVYPLPN